MITILSKCGANIELNTSDSHEGTIFGLSDADVGVDDGRFTYDLRPHKLFTFFIPEHTCYLQFSSTL